MKALIPLILLLPAITNAQSKSLAQFVTWQPKPGMEKNFEEGYKRHLGWHKNAGDTWNWYGWYFISGPRSGQFMDATIDHAFKDFDKPVDPEGDAADNAKNTEPYANFLNASKLMAFSNLSTPGTEGLRAKYMKLITLHVLNEHNAEWLIRRYRNQCDMSKLKFFVTYKTFDGGRLDHWYILIGANSWADFEATISHNDILIDSTVLKSVTSEMLRYREDLSLFP